MSDLSGAGVPWGTDTRQEKRIRYPNTRETHAPVSTHIKTHTILRARVAALCPWPTISTERLHRTQVTGYLQACTLTFRQSTETAHKHEIRFCKLRVLNRRRGSKRVQYKTKQVADAHHRNPRPQRRILQTGLLLGGTVPWSDGLCRPKRPHRRAARSSMQQQQPRHWRTL